MLWNSNYGETKCCFFATEWKLSMHSKVTKSQICKHASCDMNQRMTVNSSPQECRHISALSENNINDIINMMTSSSLWLAETFSLKQHKFKVDDE